MALSFMYLAVMLTVTAHCNGEQKIIRQLAIDGLSSEKLSTSFYYTMPATDTFLNYDTNRDMYFRQLSIINNLLKNRLIYSGNFKPFNKFVLPIVQNPNPLNTLLSSSPCTGIKGESGTCIFQPSCSAVGGKMSGSCSLGRVCCINKISACSETATVNNTYWQSPSTLNNNVASCSLTVKLDKRLPEQNFPICQLRLDFSSFTIAQPAPGGDTAELQAQATQCLTDTFRVSGTLNTIPTICGDNGGQHMYLHVPPSDKKPTYVKLKFNFGSSSFTRSWKISIAMLPCAANFLAPLDCLQYFTSASGTVSSFNWADVAADGARQLANQHYRICFRSEVFDNKKRAKKLCISECPVSNGGDAFLLSSLGRATDTALAFSNKCFKDSLVMSSANHADDVTKSADKFCGNFIGADTATKSATICSEVQPFGLEYFTNDSEGFSATDGPTELKNAGFCLKFQLQ